MVSRFLLVLFLSLFLLTAACNGTPPPSPSILPNLLVQVEGRVEVRRQGSIRFVPVGLGAEVQAGDTLHLLEGKAAVFCGNETLWDKSPQSLSVGEEKSGVPCLAGRQPRPTPDIVQLRGDTTNVVGDIPYVLSPRSGWVLDDRLALRWHVLPGVGAYTVTLVSDDGQERTAVTASGGELAYPDTWPPLQAGGANYRLHVERGGRRSDEGDTFGQGFSLLNPDQMARVRDQAAHLRKRPLTETALTLLLAELYLSYDLRSEAVEMLVALPDGDQVVAVQRLLGETYLAMGLSTEAEMAFYQALALAQAAGLPEDEAAAHFGLGLAACGQWDETEAQEQWEQAREQYQTLGMAVQTEEVAKWLADVAQTCSPPPTPSPTPDSSGGANE